MKHAPIITDDGHVVDLSDVHFNTDLDAPQATGVMRFQHTSDALRGLMRDISDRARSENKPISSYFDISGRSGHSRIGIDVLFTDDPPIVSDKNRSIEFNVVITALNRLLSESLSELQLLTKQTTVDLGRLFIPMSEALTKHEIFDAVHNRRLMLPKRHEIDAHGVIQLPLDDVRYVLSERLTKISENFSEMIVRGKHGLNLFQNQSPAGLPSFIDPKEFMVSAVRIAFGPYTAFIERNLSHDGVFHLASRLFDGIRTTGIDTPRHVELYNKTDAPIATNELFVRLKLYPAEERVARIADRILIPGKAEEILARGADFTDLTNIFDEHVSQTLFDEISASPDSGGSYGRLLMPNRVVNLPWEQEEGLWIPEFQWRLIYESVRGHSNFGVLTKDEIPRRFREFIEDLTFVGGEQNLSRVFVADCLPPVDTLRVLMRNGIGVILIKSINTRTPETNMEPDLYLNQTQYEELCRFESEGMRFYLCCDNCANNPVREFYQGYWVTHRGKSLINEQHTTISMFGSAVDQIQPLIEKQLLDFFKALQDDERLGENFAVAHGSGPGVMKAVDDACQALGIFRFGVGIDAERLGQATNTTPEAIVQFVSLALNTRQDLLDRRSLFKIFNIGGYGTAYEINMALTFMKIGHCLPAPYIFIDPLGLGKDGQHLWQQSIDQFTTISTSHTAGKIEIPPLGPAWVAHCCHTVQSYEQGLKIIKKFIDNPAEYWKNAGIPTQAVRTARNNLTSVGVVIPPYIEDALAKANDNEKEDVDG